MGLTPKENTRAQRTNNRQNAVGVRSQIRKKHTEHKPTMTTTMKRTRSSSFSYAGMIRLLLVLLGMALALAAATEEEDHHEPFSRRTRTVPTTTLATHPNAVSPRPPRFATSPIPHHQGEDSQEPPYTAETTTKTRGDTVHDLQSFRYGAAVVTLLSHRRILLPPLGDTDASTPITVVPPPPLVPPGLPAPPNGCDYVCDQDEDEEDPDKDDNEKDSPKKNKNNKKKTKDQSSHSGKKEKGQGKKETMTKTSKQRRHSGKKESHQHKKKKKKKKKNPQDRTRHQQRRQLITQSTTSRSSGSGIPIGSDTPIDIETCRLVCVDGAPLD